MESKSKCLSEILEHHCGGQLSLRFEKKSTSRNIYKAEEFEDTKRNTFVSVVQWGEYHSPSACGGGSIVKKSSNKWRMLFTL